MPELLMLILVALFIVVLVCFSTYIAFAHGDPLPRETVTAMVLLCFVGLGSCAFMARLIIKKRVSIGEKEVSEDSENALEIASSAQWLDETVHYTSSFGIRDYDNSDRRLYPEEETPFNHIA